MSIGDHNSRADRLRVALDHYLDLGRGLRGEGLSEGRGEVAIWPCPSCKQGTFVANLDEGVAGCVGEGCETPSSMDLVEMVAYLDEELEVGDRQRAGERFAGILEAAVRGEQESEEGRKEEKRQEREEKRWQKGVARARANHPGIPEERLF